MNCKYVLVPRRSKKRMCFAYVEAYGKAWCPECKEENCPLKHPELLNGQELPKEVKGK